MMESGKELRSGGQRGVGCGWEMRTKRSSVGPSGRSFSFLAPPSDQRGLEGISPTSPVPAHLAHPLTAPRQVRSTPVPELCFRSLPQTHVSALSFHCLLSWFPSESNLLLIPTHVSRLSPQSGHSLLWAALGPDSGSSWDCSTFFAPAFSPRRFLGPLYQDLSLGICSGCQQAYSVRQSPSGGAQEDLGAERGHLTRMEQEGAQKGPLKKVLIWILKNKFQDKFGVIHGLDQPVKNREV